DAKEEEEKEEDAKGARLPNMALEETEGGGEEVEEGRKGREVVVGAKVEKLLGVGVGRWGVIRSPKLPSLSYSTAANAKEFWSWNMGKRKSVEWQRARALRLDLQRRHASDAQVQALTTRQVMVWCRDDGHTPVKKVKVVKVGEGVAEGSPYCRWCGSVHPKEGNGEPGGEEACWEKVGMRRGKVVSLTPFGDVFADVDEGQPNGGEDMDIEVDGFGGVGGGGVLEDGVEVVVR
ncbi:YEATS domain-containing protein 2, partial [Rhizophlyctis rosea]